MLLEGLPAFVRVFHIMKYIMLKLIVITFSQQPNTLRFSLSQAISIELFNVIVFLSFSHCLWL